MGQPFGKFLFALATAKMALAVREQLVVIRGPALE